MTFDEQTIKKILQDGHYVTDTDLARAADFTKAHNATLVEYLFSEGILNHAILGQAVAESMKVGFADLSARPPLDSDMEKIPADLAEHLRVVYVSGNEKKVKVATDDPTKGNLAKDLEPIFGKKKIEFVFAMPDDITHALSLNHKQLDTGFSKIIQNEKRIAPSIIEEIIEDALSFRASDIHLEPQRDKVVVRFRVDGVLQDAGKIPKEHYGTITNRIKVESRLRIDEHLATQDGSMRYEKDGVVVDLRTSIVPTVEGEKIVLRLLSSYIEGLNLAELGLSTVNQKMLETAAQKPFGMILVTGPTGSGKTTTLYSLLKILNTPYTNITTIEDPVEYKIAGINQIQVNPATDLTFARGLRSIVRQDPDIILVGEIRDQETVDISVNAALTGHLLLSTFHANNAATAVPRLLTMGAEPFLLSSTIELVIAQRLVRKICNACRYSVTKLPKDMPSTNVVEKYIGKKFTIYKGKGCNICGGTGYKGRTAIFEFITMTQEMKDLVLKSPSTQEVWALAEKQGSKSLFEDGIEKVKNGVTTIEELLRVAEPIEDSVSRRKKTK